MKCRNCGEDIDFIKENKRQRAIHSSEVGAIVAAGTEVEFTSPHPGQMRKLRVNLEKQCAERNPANSPPEKGEPTGNVAAATAGGTERHEPVNEANPAHAGTPEVAALES